MDFEKLSAGILVLLAEKGRVVFLTNVGEELDRSGSSIVHRKAWSELLRTV